jgi:hypothetical protein
MTECPICHKSENVKKMIMLGKTTRVKNPPILKKYSRIIFICSQCWKEIRRERIKANYNLSGGWELI